MDKRTLTFLNMTIVLCLILLFFMRFGQGGRFGWPFYIGVFYMVPYIVRKNKNISPFILNCFSCIFSPLYSNFNSMEIIECSVYDISY